MIDKFLKLKSLSLAEWRYLLLALFMLPIAGILLHVSGYRKTRNLLSRLVADNPNRSRNQEARDKQIYSIVRMVVIAARYGLYQASCLRQSLVIWWLLARDGINSEIRFGVDRINESEIDAHAWVECDGIDLCNSEALQKKYSRLEKYRPLAT